MTGSKISKVVRICEVCETEFKVCPHELKRRPCNFCSNKCFSLHSKGKPKKGLSVKSRFIENIDHVNSNGCHIWKGYTNKTRKDGYGRFSDDGKIRLAHRVSWELFVGEIPGRLLVLHKCDTRNCVNPDHLFLGTHKDNAEDKVSKGRQSSCSGEKHGRSKLKKKDIFSILEKLKNNKKTQKEIAKEHEISASQVRNIGSGKQWEDLFVEFNNMNS